MREDVEKPTDPDGLILEAWAQGLMVGSLLIMAAITIANMKKKVLLHKLIFAEVRATRYFPRFPQSLVHSPLLSIATFLWKH